MTTFNTRMPAGIPGTVQRIFEATIEGGIYQANAMPIGYGVPLTVDATTRQYRGLTAGDAGTAVIGFAVRPYPAPAWDFATQTTFGGGAPSPVSPMAGVLKRGYIDVLNNNGVTAKGNAVYVRIASPSGSKVVGGIEAAADGANTVLIPGAYFTGPADSAGNTEIAYNL